MSWKRKWWLGATLVGAAAVALGWVAVAGLQSLFASNFPEAGKGEIHPKQYAAVALGESQGDVRTSLGEPGSASMARYFPKDISLQCDYYQEADTVMDPGSFMICYSHGAVAKKESCGASLDTAVAGEDVPTCVES